MLRLLRTPRWLALTAAALVAAVLLTWLGCWQLERARAAARPKVVDPAPVSLTSIGRPRTPLTAAAAHRTVTVTGAYDAGQQRLVAGREQGGRMGGWVLTPLVLDDGAAVPVVRGWTAATAVSPPPTGPVRVTGALQPSEDAEGAPGSSAASPDQLAVVSTAQLAGLWSYDLYDGYVLLQRQDPPGAGDLEPVPAPVVRSGGGLPLQNAAYALQWWAFALFTVFMWWRLLRDEARARVAAVGVGTGGAGAAS